MKTEIDLSQLVDIDDLPSPPAIAARLLEMCADPSVDLDDLSQVLSTDPSLSARIIAFANSPLIALSRQVTHIRGAVMVLGMRMVKTLALSFSIVGTGGREINGLELDPFWNCSLLRASAAKRAAARMGVDPDEAFLCGLMLDIGQLALAASGKSVESLLEAHPELARASQWTGETNTENATIDLHLVSGLLLQQWKFPAEISLAVRDLNDSGNLTPMQKVLVVTSIISGIVEHSEWTENSISDARSCLCRYIGVSEDELEPFLDEVLVEWQTHASLLELDGGSISPEELERRAKKQIALLSMSMQLETTEVLAENERLKAQANVDQLTGLGNRRHWDLMSSSERERAIRSKHAFAMMVIDIDYFKKVNDTFGHQAGDEVLRHVAYILKHNIRKYDEVFRYGGEEFVVLLPECRLPAAADAADRLRTAVANAPAQFEDRDLAVTISIGVAQWCPENQPSIAHLFAEADQMLYQAKRDGRNCVRWSEPADTASSMAPVASHGQALSTGTPVSQ